MFEIVGGMVLQTNMSDILARIEDQNRLVKQEAGLSAAPAAVVHQLKSMNLPQQFKDMKLPDLPQAIKVKSLYQPSYKQISIAKNTLSPVTKLPNRCDVNAICL